MIIIIFLRRSHSNEEVGFRDLQSPFAVAEKAAIVDDSVRAAVRLALILQNHSYPLVSILDEGFPKLIEQLTFTTGTLEPLILGHDNYLWEKFLLSTNRNSHSMKSSDNNTFTNNENQYDNNKNNNIINNDKYDNIDKNNSHRNGNNSDTSNVKSRSSTNSTNIDYFNSGHSRQSNNNYNDYKSSSNSNSKNEKSENRNKNGQNIDGNGNCENMPKNTNSPLRLNTSSNQNDEFGSGSGPSSNQGSLFRAECVVPLSVSRSPLKDAAELSELEVAQMAYSVRTFIVLCDSKVRNDSYKSFIFLFI